MINGSSSTYVLPLLPESCLLPQLIVYDCFLALLLALLVFDKENQK